MKCVFINLDRCAARRAWMEQKADMLGVPFERIPAVDGKYLSEAEIVAIAGDISREQLSASAVACFLSHRKAWEIAAASDAPYTAIFEDDMHFSKAARDFLKDDSWIPRDADIVRLEFHEPRCEVEAASIRVLGNRRLHRLRSSDVGSGACILSRECAQRLLRDVTRISVEFDQVLFNPESPVFHGLRIYKLFPSLCIQDKYHDRAGVQEQYFGSDIDRIEPTERAKSKVAGLSKFAREARRIARQAHRVFAIWLGTKATVQVRAKYS